MRSAQAQKDRLERWLDLAQRSYLMKDGDAHIVPIRQRRGIADDYQQLEHFLQDHPLIKVSGYRSVKEERVHISRPSQLKIDWPCLLYYRPALKLLKPEVSKWQGVLAKMGMDTFLEENYLACLREPAVTKASLHVFHYLISQRGPNSPWLLPRQLPHTESTKLIGQEGVLLKLFSHWRKEDATWNDFFRRFRIFRRAMEFRIFAPHCSLQGGHLRRFHGLLSKDWIYDFDFSDLTQTLIVENRQTLQALCERTRNTLLIFGAGWGASQLVELTSSLPQPLYYWGDLDKEGFEIFSYLNEHIPGLKPLLMDQATYEQYRHLALHKEPFYGPFKSLPEGLQSVYENICRSGQRIEQEKLSITHFPLDL